MSTDLMNILKYFILFGSISVANSNATEYAPFYNHCITSIATDLFCKSLKSISFENGSIILNKSFK